jgi:hypothetical protein
MEQLQIVRESNDIVMRFFNGNYTEAWKMMHTANNILKLRGITPTMPMYATARLMVLRDLLRVWEGE